MTIAATVLTALVLDFVLALPFVQSAEAERRPAGALSPEERALVTFIDAHNSDALALLERVVNRATKRIRAIR